LPLSQIDAVNLISKFRTELEKEGDLMTEIEKRFGIQSNQPGRDYQGTSSTGRFGGKQFLSLRQNSISHRFRG
jgi:hypothetical protein